MVHIILLQKIKSNNFQVNGKKSPEKTAVDDISNILLFTLFSFKIKINYNMDYFYSYFKIKIDYNMDLQHLKILKDMNFSFNTRYIKMIAQNMD